MSFIGNNIRKIRGVKNLNQSDFADLFNLKRASIGAYEEGRAEPKIATVIQIAKYFGIGTDDLLTKELSVNDLYRFDIFKKELSGNVKHNLSPTYLPIEVMPLPLVSINDRETYLADRDNTSSLVSINLPLPKGMFYRAFELEDDSMSYAGHGGGQNDIIVGCKPNGFKKDQLEEGKLYIVETADRILFRRLAGKSLNKLSFEPLNPDHYMDQVQSKEVQDVWQVCKLITKNIGNEDVNSQRLKVLEQELRQIKTKLSQ